MKKEKFILVFFLLIVGLKVVSQNFGIEDLIRQVGYSDIQIGMTLSDLQKIHPEIHLSQPDGSAYVEDGCHLCPQFLDFKIFKIYYQIDNHKKLSGVSWNLIGTGMRTDLRNILRDLFGNSVSIDSVSKRDVMIFKSDSLILKVNVPYNSEILYVSLKSSLTPLKELDPREFDQRSWENYKNNPVNKKGRGNGSFNLSILKIESVLNGHTTIAGFKKILGQWSFADWYDLDGIKYMYNEKTHNHSTPIFSIPFITTISKREYKVVIEVINSLQGEIKSISFKQLSYQKGDDIDLYDFESSLMAHGYHPGRAYKSGENYYHKKI